MNKSHQPEQQSSKANNEFNEFGDDKNEDIDHKLKSEQNNLPNTKIEKQVIHTVDLKDKNKTANFQPELSNVVSQAKEKTCDNERLQNKTDQQSNLESNPLEFTLSNQKESQQQSEKLKEKSDHQPQQQSQKAVKELEDDENNEINSANFQPKLSNVETQEKENMCDNERLQNQTVQQSNLQQNPLEFTLSNQKEQQLQQSEKLEEKSNHQPQQQNQKADKEIEDDKNEDIEKNFNSEQSDIPTTHIEKQVIYSDDMKDKNKTANFQPELSDVNSQAKENERSQTQTDQQSNPESNPLEFTLSNKKESQQQSENELSRPKKPKQINQEHQKPSEIEQLDDSQNPLSDLLSQNENKQQPTPPPIKKLDEISDQLLDQQQIQSEFPLQQNQENSQLIEIETLEKPSDQLSDVPINPVEIQEKVTQNSDEGLQQENQIQNKKNCAYYEKNGITFEVELSQPIATEQPPQGDIRKSFYGQTSENQDILDPNDFFLAHTKIVTIIEPIKQTPEQINQAKLNRLLDKKKQEIQKKRQSKMESKSSKDNNTNTKLSRPINEQKKLSSKELKKRDLYAKMSKIQKEIDSIDAQEDTKKFSQSLPREKIQSQPKVKLIYNKVGLSQKAEPKIIEPLIKKINQIAVMIKISDDPQKKSDALKLVMRLNQERKERDIKYHDGFVNIEGRIQTQLEQVINERREMSSKIDNQRKLKIMERITLHEKIKYEMAMKQDITRQFLKDLQQQGPDNGQMSKKLVVNLKQDFSNLANLQGDVESKEDPLSHKSQPLYIDSGNKFTNIESSKSRNLGSIFTEKVLREDNQRMKDEKRQLYMKRELYNRRKEYSKHVNKNFLPKINVFNMFSSPEDLLKRDYRQNLVDHNEEDFQPDEIRKYSQEEINGKLFELSQPNRIKKLSKMKAQYVHNEIFDKQQII